MFGLVILYIIGYIILAWRRLDWAVMVLLAALPSYLIRFAVFSIPTTLLEAMILIVFIVFLAKNYQVLWRNLKLRVTSYKLQEFKRYPFDIEAILLLIISWIGIIVAGATDASFGVWKAYFFEPVLVFILIVNVFKKDIHKILWPLAISALAVSLIAIFQKTTGLFVVAEFWPRVTGPFPYPNALGLYLGPLILVMTGWMFRRIQDERYKIQKDKWAMAFITTTILTSLAGIILASSEGALVGVLTSLIVCGFFLLLKNKLRWLPITIFGLIVVFVLLSPVFFLKIIPEHKYYNFDSEVLNYLSDKAMLKDFSGEVRKQQWRETWTMLSKDYCWLIGSGLSGYQTAIQAYHQEGIFFNFSRDTEFRTKIVWFDEEYKAKHWRPVEIYMYPHNILLNFWVELGLAGALLFVWIIGKFFYLGIRNYELKIKNNKNKDYLILGIVGAMIVIIVHGIVDVPYFKNDLAIMFWAMLALIGTMHLKIKDESK